MLLYIGKFFELLANLDFTTFSGFPSIDISIKSCRLLALIFSVDLMTFNFRNGSF